MSEQRTSSRPRTASGPHVTHSRANRGPAMSVWGPLASRYEVDRPRKMLSIDGGGDGQGEPLPLSRDLGRAFLYTRYQARLTKRGLEGLGLGDIDAQAVRSMAAIDQMDNLQRIGRKVGEQVSLEHFGSFV